MRKGTTASLLTTLLLFFAASPAVGQDAPGDLIITEFIANPEDVSDGDGEYFEVYNDTGSDINLNGYTVSDNGSNSFTVNDDVIVSPGDFAVLCENADATANGGVACDYDYPNSFSIANGDDEIILTDQGVAVFSLTFTDGDAFNFDNNGSGTTGGDTGVAAEIIDFQAGRDGVGTGPAGSNMGNEYQAAAMNINGQDEDGNGALDRGSPGTQGGTLPVEFAGAPQATVNGQDVTLRWTTLTEENNLGFYVQHQRTDQSAWTTTPERVDGAGNSASEQHYDYTVADLAPGTYTFRVKQEDTDGDESFSQGVEATVRAGGFALQAPSQNPFQGRTVLRYSAPPELTVNAALYNSLGQQVRTLSTSASRIEVRAEGLASGLYFVRLKAGDRVDTQSITLVR